MSKVLRQSRVESLCIVEIRQMVDETLVPFADMVVSTLQPLGTLTLLTLVDLVVERVVHLFFPTVASRTVGLHRATFMILANECSSLPVLAKLSRVVVK